jgi:hypothetical protein
MKEAKDIGSGKRRDCCGDGEGGTTAGKDRSGPTQGSSVPFVHVVVETAGGVSTLVVVETGGVFSTLVVVVAVAADGPSAPDDVSGGACPIPCCAGVWFLLSAGCVIAGGAFW